MSPVAVLIAAYLPRGTPPLADPGGDLLAYLTDLLGHARKRLPLIEKLWPSGARAAGWRGTRLRARSWDRR